MASQPPPVRGRRFARRSFKAVLLGLAASALVVSSTGTPSVASGAAAAPLALCGNPGPAPVSPQHVIVVMMENLSYNAVVGSHNAPYQTSLANQCGVATSEFAATHTSAANYLAVSAGRFPASSPRGCGSVPACADPSDNLYSQLANSGSTWGAYEESMPTPCGRSNYGAYTAAHDLYGVGHNPAVFYSRLSLAQCQANDLPVADLTAQSGALWNALQAETLPAFSFVTPNAADDNESLGTKAQSELAGDTWLQKFVGTVQQSNSYQAGNTLLLIAYDEGGEGADKTTGEDCTNPAVDLPIVNGVSTNRDSCHVPLFVVYPYTPAGDHDATFFDHYSITKTVEQLFGLPYLAHAADPQTTSLVGSFGITAGVSQGQPPQVLVTQPVANSIVSGTVGVSGTAVDGAGVASVQVDVDGGTSTAATGTTTWSTSIDTTALTDGVHTINVHATDTGGQVGTASVIVTVNNGLPPPPDLPPIAAATATCTDLTCSFDASTSHDPDGSVASYSWNFGDGSAGSGMAPSHSYAAAGTYGYSLTVTDNQGVSSTLPFQATVTPTAQAASSIGFRAAAHAYIKSGAAGTTGASVTTPSQVRPGDTELLFVSSAVLGSMGAPAGWSQVSQVNSSPLQVTVYKHVATSADPGAKVGVPVIATTAVALQLLDYSGVGPAVSAVGAVDNAHIAHTAPQVSVAAAGSWVLSYWADKSSTTTGWVLPAAVTSRDIVVGTSSGRVTGAAGDSGGPAAVGTYPAQTASVVGGASGKAAMLSVRLPPAG